MARIYGLKKKLAEYKIDEMLVKEIIGNGDLVDVTSRMESLLDIKLRTKEIVSSPINSTGREPCEFIFEII